MGIKFLGFRLFVVLILIVSVSNSYGVDFTIFDVDGPIFYAQKGSSRTKGVFGTPIKLFKLRNLPNRWTEIPNTPDIVEVSQQDLDTILSRFNSITQKNESILSPGEGSFGQIHELVKINGIEFNPGYYYIKVPESFEYFREAPQGKNYLLESYKKSRELDRTRKGTFRGRYFQAFQELLSRSPESAETVGVLSSRSHSKEEWAALQREMIKDGEIKYKMSPSNIHMVGRAQDYQQYGMTVDDIETRKIEVLKAMILELADVPVAESDRVISPNGTEEANLHTLHYVENDQSIFLRAIKELRTFATMRMHGNRINVKIILTNAGTDFDVEKSRLPRHIVIGTNGVYRSAQRGEILDSFLEADGLSVRRQKSQKVKTDKKGLQCRQLFL